MFAYSWKCGWGHVDPQGIAHYPRLVTAMHQAGEEFMDAIGAAYWDVPEMYDIHLPIVAVDLEFERPVEVGDVLDIRVEPELGTKSLTLSYTAVHESGATAYTGEEKHVCVSKSEGGSRELPADLRRRIDERVA